MNSQHTPLPLAQKAGFAATFVFALVSCSVLALVPAETLTLHAADGTSWTDPARGLVTHGAFLHPDIPGEVMNYRAPAYPILVAFFMLISETQFPTMVAGFQLVLLVTTASIYARIASTLLPIAALPVFCLTMFNPNAWGTAFFVQSETLNAFFVALIAWALVVLVRSPSIKGGVYAGTAIAFACLIRPEAQFLIVFGPFLILCLIPFSSDPSLWNTARWRGGVIAALGCLVAAILVTAPWMAWNAHQGDGYRLTASGNTEYYVWGSAAQIEMESSGVSEAEAENRVRTVRAAFIESQGTRWATLAPSEQDSALTRAGLSHILSYPPEAIFKNVTKATLQFFIAGGSGRLFILAGQPDASPFAVMVAGAHSSHLEAVGAMLAEADWGLLFIWIIAFGFAVLGRLVGLLGLVWLWQQRRYDLLIILVSGIAYYALIIPFYGISRFRVAVEGPLMLLAVLGGIWIWQKIIRPPSLAE